MNPSSAVDWVLPLAVLAAGLGLGSVVVWRVMAPGRAAAPARPAAPSLARRDLEGKRDVLLRQLRELDDLAAKRNPEQLARERYALELEAARVLQDLDGLPAEPGPAPVTAAEHAGPLAAKPALRGFLWGTGSMAAIGLLIYLVGGAAQPREEGASLTGGPAPTAGTVESLESRAREAVARNPDDLEARLALARVLLARQDMMGVWNETKYVLQRSPGDTRALSYQALVRLAMGQPDLALDMLKDAQARAPDQFDVYVHLALVYSRMGRKDDARKTLAEVRRRFPQQAELLGQLEAEIARAETEGPAPGASEDAHAAVPPPPVAAGAASRPAGPPPPGRKKRLAGVVDIDPALAAEVPPGAIVFITVREAGFGAGPPMAAKRLVAGSFPVRFEITEADSMTGEPIPNEVLLEARVDSDGDPMTRSPRDPKARLDDVKAGSGDVRLVLKR